MLALPYGLARPLDHLPGILFPPVMLDCFSLPNPLGSLGNGRSEVDGAGQNSEAKTDSRERFLVNLGRKIPMVSLLE